MPAVRPAQGDRRGGLASIGSGESTTARGPGRPADSQLIILLRKSLFERIVVLAKKDFFYFLTITKDTSPYH